MVIKRQELHQTRVDSGYGTFASLPQALDHPKRRSLAMNTTFNEEQVFDLCRSGILGSNEYSSWYR